MQDRKRFVTLFSAVLLVILLTLHIHPIHLLKFGRDNETPLSFSGEGDIRRAEPNSTAIEVTVPSVLARGEQMLIFGLLISTENHARLSQRTVKLFWNNELVRQSLTGTEGYLCGRFEFNYTVERQPGEHSVTIVYSGDDEYDYSQYKRGITVKKNAPDLLVNNRHIFITPEMPVTNSSVEISSVIRNIGSHDAQCRLSLFQDRISERNLIEEHEISVPKGAEKKVITLWRAVPGDHLIWVSVNSVVPEDENRYNNLAYRSIYVDPVDNGSWTMFRHDIHHSGYTPGDGPADKTLLWYARDINVGSYTAAKSSPAVFGDKVVIGGDTGKLTAFHKYSGNKLWEFRTGDTVKGIHSSPTIYDNKVFFGSYDHKVYSLDLETGEELWSYDTRGWVGASPSIIDGKVLIGSDVGFKRGQLIALDADTGEQLWAFDAAGDIHSSPAVNPELGMVYVGSNDNNVYALDLNGVIDGNNGVQEISLNRSDLVWNTSTGNAIKASPAVDIQSGMVIVPSWDGYLYALDGLTGNTVWKRYLGSYLYSSPAIANGVIIVAEHYRNGNVRALDIGTGDDIWSFPTGGYAIGSPSIANDTVYLGLKGNDIIAFDLETGNVKWWYDNFANVTSSPAVASGMMFVSSDAPEGILYAFGNPQSLISFSEKDVSIRPEYPVAGHPLSIDMTLNNLGTVSSRLKVDVLSRDTDERESDEYILLDSKTFDVNPWVPGEVSFEVVLDRPGVHEIIIELSEIPGTGKNGIAQEAGFVYGRQIRMEIEASLDSDGDGMPDAWETRYGTDPASNDATGDPDGDGLNNLGEYWEHLLPDEPDTDLDGLDDWLELDMSSDPLNPDTDGDGVPDGWEYSMGEQPLIPGGGKDGDNDGLTCLREYEWGCAPDRSDSDGDMMPNGWEVMHTGPYPGTGNYAFDPMDETDAATDKDNDGFDADNDGSIKGPEMLTNLEEFFYGTDPTDNDTNFDGIPDGKELYNEDFDGDTLSNGWEELHSLDPFSGNDKLWDSDGDGLPNQKERSLGTHPTDADTDDDGLADGTESDLGTDPSDNDTDGDGMPDGWEILHDLNPLDLADVDADDDGDGWTNIREYAAGTDPQLKDTDDDGITDNNDPNPLDFDPRAVLVLSVGGQVLAVPGETIPQVDSLLNITFDGSRSYDTDDNLTLFSFHYGDGNDSGWTDDPVKEHSYSKAGIYTVELTVLDENGFSNVIREVRDIRILNRLPEIAIELAPDDTLTFSPVTVDIIEAYDPDGRITNLSVEWGDGNTSFIEPDHSSSPPPNDGGLRRGFHRLQHNYSRSGIYPVRSNAVDDDGGSREVSMVVTIRNRPPICVITVPDVVYLNSEIILDASQSYDPDGSIVEYLWSFEDGRTLRGARVYISFSTAGTNTVTLSVTDSHGEKSQQHRNIFVQQEGRTGKEKDMYVRPLYVLGLVTMMLIIAVCAIITIRKNASKRREMNHPQIEPYLQKPETGSLRMEELQGLSGSPGPPRKKVHRRSIRKKIIRKRIKNISKKNNENESSGKG